MWIWDLCFTGTLQNTFSINRIYLDGHIYMDGFVFVTWLGKKTLVKYLFVYLRLSINKLQCAWPMHKIILV